jgi:hypothetical protein
MTPPLAVNVSLPPNGIPDDRLNDLAELLAYVRRHLAAGRPAAEVRAEALCLARSTRVPLFSAGGLCECIDAVLAEVPGVAA